MKTIIKFALAALALVAAASCNRYEKVAGDPLNTRIYTLDNGLQVYMTVNKQEPRIQTYIAVKVGSKNDPSETTGLAHYFEHLMFKGTEQFGTSDYAAEKPMLDEIEQLFEVYRTTTDEAARKAIYHKIDSVSYEASKLAIPNEYDKLMSLIGAQGTNAWTSSDETVYTEDIPSNQIDNWARIQADRFRNNVIRGFHTELETIYEEKNMSLTKDNRKVWEALGKQLYPHHPYGQQTTLGTQEHLKNPSITNVKKYHDTYYVPNNIRICVSGDFNPKEMVAAIEKYWGDWQPNNDLPKLEFEQEEPITEPISVDVVGLESEYMAMGWRLPAAADLKTAAVAEIAGEILSNGTAGLIDLDVIQEQKVLWMQAGYDAMADYGEFIVMGAPKQGQTLEEVRDIALEEFEKLREGDFDDDLIESTINNLRYRQMRELEKNRSRAMQYVQAFINGVPWKDACHHLDLLKGVTKEDVVAFAQEYLSENSYVAVYKRQGVDNNVLKISAPAITPIVTNRDKQSAFLAEIQASQVKPIEPVFVDFSKDMSAFDFAPGAEVLYKKNDVNGTFDLNFVFNTGSEDNPELETALAYLDYLGTPSMDCEEFKSHMYSLACSYSANVGANRTFINISGLSENMEEAVKTVGDLMNNAEPDEEVLAALKADIFRARANAKTSQRSCASALLQYASFGPEYIRCTVLPDEAIQALTSEQLLSKVREVLSSGHEIQYYGPLSEAKFKAALALCHKVAEGAELTEESFTDRVATPENRVILCQYDAKQIYYYQYSNRGEKFDATAASGLRLYNEYFGGGMNTIVFQEMREARGLAYSAWARLYQPSFADGTYNYMAFIATQNDKMQTAIEAFDDIINDMPCSETAFSIAKEAVISGLRTDRTNGKDVLNAYVRCRRLGLGEPLDKKMFEEVQTLTLDDVVAVQQQWVKGRNYTYAILGDIKDLDTAYLATLGKVEVVSLEDIFGY